MKALLERHPVFSADTKMKRLTTFAAVKKEYPDRVESRRYGKSRTT